MCKALSVRLLACVALFLGMAHAEAAVYTSSGSPQAAENSLEAGGGGRLYAASLYNLTGTLIISQQVATTISGDGSATGFNYANPTGNNNAWQIGQNAHYAGDFKAYDITLSNNMIAGVRPPAMTGIFATQSGAPYFDGVTLDGFATATWFHQVWAAKFYHVKLINITGFGFSFDNSTPANNTTLDMCEGFGVVGAIVHLEDGNNGLYIKNGDFESIGSLVEIIGQTWGPVSNTLVIEQNDIETMSGALIANTSGIRLKNLSVSNNTFADSHDVVIANVDGGHMEGNTFWNTNVIVNQSSNTNFSFDCAKQNLLGTSTCTIQ